MYSRYLTWQPGKGLLHLSVSVTDDHGRAFTVTPGPPVMGQPVGHRLPACCGSAVRVPELRRRKIYTFEQNHTATIVAVAGAGGRDTLPPGKIGDLSVVHADSGKLVARWTAVGGDFDDGQTDVYRLYYAVDIHLLIGNISAAEFVEFNRYDMAGTAANHTFQLPRSGLLYLGLRAGDLTGNYGLISNLVPVELGEPSGPTNIVPTDQPSAVPGDWTLIGIVLGVIFILVLCLLVLVVSILCGKRGKKKPLKTRSSGVNVHIPSPSRSEATDVSYDSDHQLVPTMAKPPPSNTSFANNLTPTYWSASQLLTEHEHRTGTLPRKPKDHPQQQPPEGYNNNNNNNSPVYAGYTITPLSKTSSYDYSRSSDYGRVGDYGYAATTTTTSATDFAGYDTYVGPNHHLDYGTVVVPPGGSRDGLSPLDYGVVSEADYGSDLVDEGLEGGTRVTDVSSSTLPMYNASLRGSLLSLNSAKKKNITQV